MQSPHFFLQFANLSIVRTTLIAAARFTATAFATGPPAAEFFALLLVLLLFSPVRREIHVVRANPVGHHTEVIRPGGKLGKVKRADSSDPPVATPMVLKS